MHRFLIATTLVLSLLAGALGPAAPAGAAPATVIVVRAFSLTGGTPTAGDNDFTRIDNAVHAAAPGDTVKLAGTFDFAEANAAAAWALGHDGTTGTDDDYEVDVPALDNLTITADYLGAATIQGPGDLPAFDLEGFLQFYNTGTNQNLTVSNLEILDFDLGIGMFYRSSAVAFNGARIVNNHIRTARDLKGASASGPESFQNIGIHFAHGTNQTIADNVIDLYGDGVSDAGATASWQFSAEVGMQSNTSGGTAYDGLVIARNTVRVLNAQSATPERIRAIWENGHAHASDVTVSDNRVTNLAGGNNPALNLQIAFRMTSHSSATTAVVYSGNRVDGANVAYDTLDTGTTTQPIVFKFNTATSAAIGLRLGANGRVAASGNSFAGLGAGTGVLVPAGTTATIGTTAGSNRISGFSAGVAVSGTAAILYSALTGNGTGLRVEGAGTASAHYSNISGNGAYGVNNTTGTTVDAANNWWGSNAGPGGANNGTAGLVTTGPFSLGLLDSVTASTHEVGETGTFDTLVTASNLYGVQFVVDHDPAVLAFQAPPASHDNDGGTWAWHQPNPFINFVTLSGGITLADSRIAPDPAATVTGQSLSTWTYRCAAPGTSALMYNTATGTGTFLSDVDGGNLRAALVGDLITCTAATAGSVTGTIRLQGRAQGAPLPAGWNGAVVTLTCTGGGCAGYGPYVFPATDVNGQYSIVKAGPGTGVALGTYSAAVTRRAYLGATKATAVTVVAGTNTVGPAPLLLGGDVIGDGVINIYDLTPIGSAFGTSVTPDTGADVNGDGFVNVFDLVLASGNYNATTSNWP